MGVNVTVRGERLSFDKGVTYREIYEKIKENYKYPALVARVKNNLREMGAKVKDGEEIEFLDYTNEDASIVYKRGVSLVMIKAVKDVLGKDAKVYIEHSIKKNYYCEIKKDECINDKDVLEKIEQRMREIVKEDIPFEKEVISKGDAIEMAKENGMDDKSRLFRYRTSSSINMYSLDGLYDYFYGYMPYSTGCLEHFRLTPCERGFLILFPTKAEPDKIDEYIHPQKISDVFMELLEWNALMGVNNVADLNDAIVDGRFGDLVRINEALHEKKIAYIADMIAKKRDTIKMVLIAGPSSSGKTTFAQRLCVQLRVNGITPHVIGLDDYFIDRDKTPKDEFGKYDFENINTLDTKQFNEDMKRLIAGETVELPSYNFVLGKREYKGNFKTLKEGEIFIIEGIHGLNDVLTESIPAENKFRIFISALTQLNIDDHNRISTSDSRLIRRIIRDSQFRGNDAAETIDTWPYVKRGEERNIFPFQENADVVFNSATVYELSILKTYALPLLYKITPDQPEYITAKRLIKFLGYFLNADGKDVPSNSIIQEFLGGSVFDVG